MSDQLSMIPGDVDVLSLFDQPAPVKASAPVASVDRCPACHGRLDGRSPRCLCAIQPEGAAHAQALDVGEHQDHADPAAERRARIVAHRERCDGQLVTNLFGAAGAGPVYCADCGYRPDAEGA